MSYMSKFIASVIGLLLLAAVAGGQLSFITGFKLPALSSLPGQTEHLWIGMIAGIAACVTAAFMYYYFRRYESNKWDRLDAIRPGPITNLTETPSTALVKPVRFDAIGWAQANPWLTHGQADDRRLMNGSVVGSGGPASNRRALARRSHQLKFKTWSQERHD